MSKEAQKADSRGHPSLAKPIVARLRRPAPSKLPRQGDFQFILHFSFPRVRETTRIVAQNPQGARCDNGVSDTRRRCGHRPQQGRYRRRRCRRHRGSRRGRLSRESTRARATKKGGKGAAGPPWPTRDRSAAALAPTARPVPSAPRRPPAPQGLLYYFVKVKCERPRFTPLPAGVDGAASPRLPGRGLAARGVELRRYAPYLVAEADVSGATMKQGMGNGFRLCAGYIFGKNDGGGGGGGGGGRDGGGADAAPRRIAMTAPVMAEEAAAGGGAGGGGGGGSSRALSSPTLFSPRGRTGASRGGGAPRSP